ncbi:O-antigen ligase family protein [Oceanihabitans sp. IOP_32]|uniref:O-antigen ligase family protein n=1 Tax=Oceanihabitans sp. IOP_32 TaxID=2529032 RepID=UPI0012939583|nr:O-antigen ligase family protein [Oceanihabitans sp. IOP_32]QFZ54428.1 O-antigen ligase family protein [Oceanihabitans sp. IOP_32]
MVKIKNIGIVNILLTLILITFVIPPPILNPILLGVLFSFVIIRHFIHKQNINKNNFNKVSFFFVLYFFVLLLSLFYSQDVANGIGVIGRSISFLLIPVIPLFISKEEINLEFIVKAYIYYLCLIFFYLIFVAIYKNIHEGYTLGYIFDKLRGGEIENGKYHYINYWYFVYDKFTSPLNIQPIYLGLFTNLGLIFIFYLKKIKKIKFYYFFLLILGLLVLLTASRWQILIFAINYFIFIIFFLKLRSYKKILLLTSLVSLILIVSIINPVTRTRLKESIIIKENFYKDQFGGTSIRLNKWISATKCISNSPMFGYGVGDGKNKLLEQFKKDKFYLGFYNKFNAHNQYLDTLLYVGVVGLFILLLIFYYSYKYAINNIYMILITNVFSIGFVTESMLNRQWGIISFSFFLIMFSIFVFKKENNLENNF